LTVSYDGDKMMGSTIVFRAVTVVCQDKQLNTFGADIRYIRTSKSNIELQYYFSAIFVPLCHSITHKAIVLESCWNPQKMQQIF